MSSSIDNFIAFIALRQCEVCENVEERVFTDSWTGKEMCIFCLAPIAERITSSPASEGDNLKKLIRDYR